MSEAEAAVKPVEAEQPEVPAVAPAEPVEKSEDKTEKPKEKTEDKTEDKPEDKPEDKSEDKPEEKAENNAEDDKDGSKKILKTTARTDYENLRNNRKFDPSSRQVTDDPAAIRKQVEFYFGDWNFPQDKFMWESCGGSENKPMKVKTIHSFKRMRTFQPYEAVVAALQDSKLLEISGEKGEEEIKRKTPYKPQAAGKAKVEASSVYVKGFGDESPDTQFELESFFAQFGEVSAVKLRRTNENLFKGSVFVTFADEEIAKKFVEMDPAPKYKDHDLKVMTKRAYCEEKNELIRAGKLEPNANQPKKFYEGQESNNRGRRSREGDDWKKRREHDQKHGFRDRRGGGRARGGGRGGGRGRGRGGFRDDRREHRGRDDRNQEKKNGEVKHRTNDTMPRIQSTAEEKPATNDNGKRGREEEGGAGERVAKKVDTKA